MLTACSGGSPRPLSAPGPLTATPHARLVTPSPVSLPSASPITGPFCRVDSLGAQGGGPLVTVDRNPSGITAGWLPGLNSRSCKAVLRRGTGTQARRLANDIRSAKAEPQGPMSCPNDEGAGVELVFKYPSGRYEQVQVLLSGCRAITDADRRPREYTQSLNDDLQPLAPAAWLAYLLP